jgi:hypothetical protein
MICLTHVVHGSAFVNLYNFNTNNTEYEENILTKKITLSSLLLTLCSASSLAFAHTTIKDQATEGTTLYTAATITHGCGDGIKPNLPVIAQSMVFPNGPSSIVTRLDNPAEPINLGDVLIGGEHSKGVIDPGGIQDKNVFSTIEELTDETGVVRGFHYADGELQVDLVGVIPFRLSGVTFKPESCVTKVRVRIGIANWCHHRPGVRRVDAWIGRTTPVFNDTRVVSLGFWPTLTINRDLAANPLPESCGEGYEVAVEPSDEDIDQYLPMSGFIPGI